MHTQVYRFRNSRGAVSLESALSLAFMVLFLVPGLTLMSSQLGGVFTNAFPTTIAAVHQSGGQSNYNTGGHGGPQGMEMDDGGTDESSTFVPNEDVPLAPGGDGGASNHD